MTASSEIKVSVCIPTYNHGDWLTACIQSVLAQITDFKFEILIGIEFDDFDSEKFIPENNDNGNANLKIVKTKEENQVIVNNRRTGRGNFINLINSAQGKYIAILDGDDYWCRIDKLQSQFHYLENNPKYVASHSWQFLAKYNQEEKAYIEEKAPKVNHGYYASPAASIVKVFSNELRVKIRTIFFKNVFLDKKYLLPGWFKQVKYGDVALSFILGQFGDFHFLDEETAVYRQTNSGVSTQGKDLNDWHLNHFWSWIEIWCYADKMYNNEYHLETCQTLREFYTRILQAYKYGFKARVKLCKKILTSLNQPISRRLKDAYFCLTVK